jgi:SAM-dependent methyltransferase
MTEIDASNDFFCAMKARLKTTWMTGDYDTFSRYMERDSQPFFERLGIARGCRLLDVGCGTGQVALMAARAGAQVTGCDIATNWLEAARNRASSEGLRITFEEGDAEALPYANARFDAVVSMFGAMFAPSPELVAAEMVRVCRPGGLIAMANWTPGGFIGQMFRAISRHIAPPGMPSPVLWGDEVMVLDRLRSGIADLKMSRRTFHFEYPFPPQTVVDFFRANFGPMARAFSALDQDSRTRLRGDLVDLWCSHNLASRNTTLVESEYLEVIATRAAA